MKKAKLIIGVTYVVLSLALILALVIMNPNLMSIDEADTTELEDKVEFLAKAYALEYNVDYFIESENAFVIISVDFNGTTSLVEGTMYANDNWQSWEAKDLKFSRILSDNNQGRFFGETDTGDLFYAIYYIDGNNAELRINIWSEDIKTTIIEQATVVSLFD